MNQPNFSVKEAAIKHYKAGNYSISRAFIELCIEHNEHHDSELYYYKAMCIAHSVIPPNTFIDDDYKNYDECIQQYLLANDNFKLATEHKPFYYDAYHGWCELLKFMHMIIKHTGRCHDEAINRFNNFLQATNNLDNVNSKESMEVEKWRKDISGMINELRVLSILTILES